VIERFGRFHKLLDSGLHLLWPVIDKIAYAHSTKEVALNISDQTAITKDNVQIGINGIVYIKVTDPIKASYSRGINWSVVVTF
jgi:regulator of protease activity HflC (stomatin/prohibitin superfamily)